MAWKTTSSGPPVGHAAPRPRRRRDRRLGAGSDVAEQPAARPPPRGLLEHQPRVTRGMVGAAPHAAVMAREVAIFETARQRAHSARSRLTTRWSALRV